MAGETDPTKTALEMQRRLGQIVAQAWSDERFKARLLQDPVTVLHEHGIDIPAGVDVRVLESTDRVKYIMLPPKPVGDVVELTSNDLAGVAGGYCCYACAPAPLCVIDICTITIEPHKYT